MDDQPRLMNMYLSLDAQELYRSLLEAGWDITIIPARYVPGGWVVVIVATIGDVHEAIVSRMSEHGRWDTLEALWQIARRCHSDRIPCDRDVLVGR